MCVGKEDSEPRTTSPHPSDSQNPRKSDKTLLDEILHKINKKLRDCRDHFLRLYPRRPAHHSGVSCSAGGAESWEIDSEDDVEYADDVMNTIEFGTSLFYCEEEVRLFAVHLCSSMQSDLVWSLFGLRIDTERKGFRTRFEVECHKAVAVFEANEWLQYQFLDFQCSQTAHPEKRRKLEDKEGQLFVQKTAPATTVET